MRVIGMAPRSILRSLGGCEGSCLGVIKQWGFRSAGQIKLRTLGIRTYMHFWFPEPGTWNSAFRMRTIEQQLSKTRMRKSYY